MALAVFFVAALFLWQGNKGFNLWDEGYLWYGTQRVMLGEVPLRDFKAYDPGRYYWSAALMTLWGDNGIMALRSGVAIFQTMGLFAGLILIARSAKKQSITYLLLSAITLVLWMYPRHKLFDISLSILQMGVLAFLIQKPTSGRFFTAGLCIGLAAVFGRNHGVYGAAGSIGAMLWMRINPAEGPGIIKGFLLWTAGVIAGYAPVLIMALGVPGFAGAFLDSILYQFEVKATNLELPVPWPWRVDYASLPPGEAVSGFLIGLFFIGIVAFGLLSIAWIIRQRHQDKQVSPVLAAASFQALPYAHYAYSRADVGHLALGIFPLLVGSLALLSAEPAKIKCPLAIMLCAASFWIMHGFHPGWQCYDSKKWVTVKISHSSLQVDPGTAKDVALLRKLADRYAPDGRSFIAAPVWPGAYALLERKSPMWDIYPLFPRSQAFELTEIERIKTAEPRFVFIFDLAVDGREELRFRNLRPLIHRYIVDHFEPIPHSGNPAYKIYTLKREAQKKS
ncbi:MAG: hypothetical protein ACU84H_00760 [Gammaproteobacteria bacterium]